jgi:hypothetical protein
MRFFFAAFFLGVTSSFAMQCTWRDVLLALESDNKPTLQRMKLAAVEILEAEGQSIKTLEAAALDRCNFIQGSRNKRDSDAENVVINLAIASMGVRDPVPDKSERVAVLRAYERAFIDDKLGLINSGVIRQAFDAAPEIVISTHSNIIGHEVRPLLRSAELVGLPKLLLISGKHPNLRGTYPERFMLGYSEEGELSRAVSAKKIHLMGGDSYHALLKTGQDALASSLRFNSEVELVMHTGAIYTQANGRLMTEDFPKEPKERQGYFSEEAAAYVEKIPGMKNVTAPTDPPGVFTYRDGTGKVVRITFLS